MRIGKYKLVKHTVQLREEKTQEIYFFVSDTPLGRLPLPIVQENVRLKLVGEETVARAFVLYLGLSIEEAAATTASFKAEIEGLTSSETDAVERHLIETLIQGELQ